MVRPCKDKKDREVPIRECGLAWIGKCRDHIRPEFAYGQNTVDTDIVVISLGSNDKRDDNAREIAAIRKSGEGVMPIAALSPDGIQPTRRGRRTMAQRSGLTVTAE